MSSDRIITPTGRLVFDNPLKGTAEDFMRKVQEAMDRFKPHVDDQGRRVVVLSGDYSRIEAHILAILAHESAVSPFVMELGVEGGSIPGLADMTTMFRQSGGQIAEVLAKKPAVKQNGRSAAYLQHDRTKRHGRPR